jgi:hypothetical protein
MINVKLPIIPIRKAVGHPNNANKKKTISSNSLLNIDVSKAEIILCKMTLIIVTTGANPVIIKKILSNPLTFCQRVKNTSTPPNIESAHIEIVK